MLLELIDDPSPFWVKGLEPGLSIRRSWQRGSRHGMAFTGKSQGGLPHGQCLAKELCSTRLARIMARHYDAPLTFYRETHHDGLKWTYSSEPRRHAFNKARNSPNYSYPLTKLLYMVYGSPYRSIPFIRCTSHV